MKHERVFLEHILEEIEFLMRETRSLNYEEFVQNEVLKRACSRSLEIIGEAVRNLPADFRRRHKDVEWKKYLD